MVKLKGLFHVHSTYSLDGTLSLEQLKEGSCKRGYDFVFFSEHAESFNEEKMNVFVNECKTLSSEEFIFIPGLEINSQEGIHILAIGIQRYIDSKNIREIIHDIHAQKGLAVLAHSTIYSNLPYEELSEIDGVEIWNSKHDFRLSPHPDSYKIYDTFRKRGIPIFVIGGLDLHVISQMGRLELHLWANENCNSANLDILKKGRFFSTNHIIKMNGHHLKSSAKYIYYGLTMISLFIRTVRLNFKKWRNVVTNSKIEK